MPLDLGNYPSRDFLTGRLIAKAMVKDNRLLRWTPYGASEQMLNLAVKILIGHEADNIEVSLGFEIAIYMGSAKPASPRKNRRIS